MIIIAGQREWVKEATESNCLKYVSTLESIKDLPHSAWIFFVHWSDKIPEEIYNRYICVGFHMTDLPYGRGGSPLQNLIIRGFKETKLTAFKITKDFDFGPIYLQKQLTLDGTAHEIYRRASTMAVEMAQEIYLTKPIPAPQRVITDNDEKFIRRKPEQSHVHYAKRGEESTYDFIRMLDAPGYPHAFIGGATWKIVFTAAKLEDGKLMARAEFKWL